MSRAKFTCEDCGDTTTEMQVHHGFYLKGRSPWEYPNESLRCLCAPCHESRGNDLAELQAMVSGLDADDLGAIIHLISMILSKAHWDSTTVRSEIAKVTPSDSSGRHAVQRAIALIRSVE